MSMTAAEAKQRGRTPPGTVLMEGASDDGRNYLIEKRVMVSGENLYDGRDGRPAAHLVIVWPHGVPVVDGMVAA